VIIYALSDPHLSHGVDKPMDVFGRHWAGHADKIADAWKRIVRDEDLVLVPGDISWATRLSEAKPDLVFLDALPGLKLLTKGNHDYWWPSKKRDFKFDSLRSMRFLHGRTVRAGALAIAATRGWVSPGDSWFRPADQKIFDKEMRFLKQALESMGDASFRLCMLHYPPFDDSLSPAPAAAALEASGVQHVVFGHLHGEDCINAARWGRSQEITYHLASCDALDFAPMRILEVPTRVEAALHSNWDRADIPRLALPNRA